MRCLLQPRPRVTNFGLLKLKRTSKRPIHAPNTAVMRSHALDAARHGLPSTPTCSGPSGC